MSATSAAGKWDPYFRPVLYELGVCIEGLLSSAARHKSPRAMPYESCATKSYPVAARRPMGMIALSDMTRLRHTPHGKTARTSSGRLEPLPTSSSSVDSNEPRACPIQLGSPPAPHRVAGVRNALFFS